ncbi:MAG: hypothetical protein JSS55_13100 [Proteobacteria bacterium]|nr:hypothetical protein [Pseudomonadota bacterium]
MVTDTAAGNSQAETNTNLSSRAAELKDRAGALFQDGIEAVKAHPAATAAVVGGVAAAAAAYVGRDKIAETAGQLRDKMTAAAKQNGSEA